MSHSKHTQAFALVHPEDWKDPIDMIVLSSILQDKGLDVDAVAEAVEFFTATKATITQVRVRVSDKETVPAYRVTASGYRAGPAGDH